LSQFTLSLGVRLCLIMSTQVDSEQDKNVLLEEKLENISNELLICQSNLIILERKNTTLENKNKILNEVCNGYKDMMQSSQRNFSNFFEVFHSTVDMLKSTTESLVKTRKRLHSCSSENGFALLLKNNCVEAYPYYSIRCRNENMEPALKRFKSKYPDARMVFSSNCAPNGMNVYNMLKDIPNAKFRRNHYDVPCSEEEMCTMLNDMCYDN
jgi:hypothetical protein